MSEPCVWGNGAATCGAASVIDAPDGPLCRTHRDAALRLGWLTRTPAFGGGVPIVDHTGYEQVCQDNERLEARLRLAERLASALREVARCLDTHDDECCGLNADERTALAEARAALHGWDTEENTK